MPTRVRGRVQSIRVRALASVRCLYVQLITVGISHISRWFGLQIKRMLRSLHHDRCLENMPSSAVEASSKLVHARTRGFRTVVQPASSRSGCKLQSPSSHGSADESAKCGIASLTMRCPYPNKPSKQLEIPVILSVPHSLSIRRQHGFYRSRGVACTA